MMIMLIKKEINMQVEVFWIVTPAFRRTFEDGGIKVLRSFGVLPQRCMASQTGSPRLESSLP
jgi:hypothetical protein